MAISPMDIHHKEFGTVRMGGYNKEEVDSFLDMVADELDRLLHRSQEQAELLESMRQKAGQFDSMQQTLQNALINAQKSADSIVQEARVQAEAQLKEAREQSVSILEDAQNERSRISHYYAGIREQVFKYIATIRELMENNKAMIEDYEARLAEAELKEQAAPVSQPVPQEPAPAPEPVPEFRQKVVYAEPAASETGPPTPVQKHDEPFVGEEGAAPEPRLETPQSPASPVPAREPMMEDFERTERPAAAEEAPPPPPVFSPEQEMEMVRESLSREEPIQQPPREQAPEPAPRSFEEPAAEPAAEPAEPSGTEESDKHFFWE